MKSQPNRNYKSDDEIMTPEYLAEALVNHFKPSGKILEPCKGTGNFLKFLPKDTLWCEISEGKNFFDFNDKVNWIITNPPWSQIRKFLQHSMKISKNVCFLFTINHLWTKARIRDIKEAGFGIKEIVIFDTPDNFPPLGFQVGMIHLQSKYSEDIIFSDLSGLIETQGVLTDTRLIGIKRKPCEVSQIPNGTSLNSDIKRNFSFSSLARSNLQ